MTTRRKTGHNTKDVAKLRHEDLEKELHLQNMQLKAQKDEKPSKPLSNRSRTSKVDEKYLLRDETENDIRAKLDRIGYNSRVEPEDLIQKKILSRPEQAEIDAYNMRLRKLGKDANANLAAEIPPSLDYLPKTEDDWNGIDGERYGLAELLHEKQFLEQEIVKSTNQIALNKRHGVIQGIEQHGVVKGNVKAIEKQEKLQKTFATSIANLERDLRNYVASLRKVDAAIKVVKELRRLYIAQEKEQYKEELEAYVEQVSALTSQGLSTQRLPNESDDDYATRMYDNVQSITTQEQLYDGQLYLLREFMAKLRSLNIPLETVESVTKLMPDDGKEWILSHWPNAQKEFVKTFGTNPYRVHVSDVIEFFVKMHEDAVGTAQQMKQQYHEDVGDEYNDEFDSAFPRIFEKKTVKTERVARMQRRKAFEDQPVVDLLDMGDPSNEYQQHMDAYDVKYEEGTGFRKIGKKIINYDKLMKRNVLDIRHLKKGNIYGFPTATVSDAFTSHVKSLINGKGVSDEDIKSLCNTEVQLFNRMKHVTGVGGSYKDSSGINALKERLKLVEDEISSGNDSTHLLVEAKDILKTLARQNIITKVEKDRFYKQLSTINN